MAAPATKTAAARRILRARTASNGEPPSVLVTRMAASAPRLGAGPARGVADLAAAVVAGLARAARRDAGRRDARARALLAGLSGRAVVVLRAHVPGAGAHADGRVAELVPVGAVGVARAEGAADAGPEEGVAKRASHAVGVGLAQDVRAHDGGRARA